MSVAPALASVPRALAAPGTYPVPAGRGRWRLTLHARSFAPSHWYDTVICELTSARSRRLERTLNSPAKLTFTLNSASADAALVEELASEVVAWRWDDRTGRDVAAFRGIVAQSEDQLTEQSATTNFTCHDYIAMLERRIITTLTTFSLTDQDAIVSALIATAKAASSSGGTSFARSSYLPITPAFCTPTGATRPRGAVPFRDRQYTASTHVSEALANLAAVQGGFDYDLLPAPEAGGAEDALRIFFPRQGVERPDVVLAYGSNVSGLTRSVTSADYANYWRVVGQAPEAAAPEPGGDGEDGEEAPEPEPVFAEAWDPRLGLSAELPFGLFMSNDEQADVSDPATLAETAAGNLSRSGQVMPSYSLTLRPGAFSWGSPEMGDEVPLIVHAGRLHVDTALRVVGFNFSINDDSDEDVELVVGRPLPSLYERLTRADSVVAALTRR